MRAFFFLFLCFAFNAAAESPAEELNYHQQTSSQDEARAEDQSTFDDLMYLAQVFPDLRKGMTELKRRNQSRQRAAKESKKAEEEDYAKLQVAAWVSMLTPPKIELCPSDEVTHDFLKKYLSSDVSKEDASIAACLSKKEEGQFKKVSQRFVDTCGRTGFGTFQLGKLGGNLSIKLNICVTYEGERSFEKYSLTQLEDTRGCVEHFYRRQGIDLNLKFKMKPNLFEVCENKIHVRDESPRADMQEWPSRIEQQRFLSISDKCSVYAHEIGHMLGLGDGYLDKDCPMRKVQGPADDLMVDGTRQIDELRLYPWQIKKIIKPFCK